MDGLTKTHKMLGIHQNHSISATNSSIKENSLTSSTLLATNGNTSALVSQTSLSAKAKHFSIDALISSSSSPLNASEALHIDINNKVNNGNNNSIRETSRSPFMDRLPLTVAINSRNSSLNALHNDLISDESNDECASYQSDLERPTSSSIYDGLSPIGQSFYQKLSFICYFSRQNFLMTQN